MCKQNATRKPSPIKEGDMYMREGEIKPVSGVVKSLVKYVKTEECIHYYQISLLPFLATQGSGRYATLKYNITI